MYALHCGLLPLNTSSPLSVTTCHISAPPLLYLSRAAGLSRLSCVTDFRIATAFYPCGGRPLTIGRVRLLAGCSTHRRAANIRGFIPGRITPGGHGSGIPPAAAPSFRGASIGRKESIRETGIEPAFSREGSNPTRPREVFRPHPGPGGMPRYSPHGSGAPPSESSRAAAVLLHMPRYVGILVRPAVRRGSVG